MDIENSAVNESLINDLKHLKSLNHLNFSKNQINLYINKLKKIAFLRYKLNEATHLEKEIACLDNVEYKFTEELRRLISFSKNFNPAHSNFERFFMGFTCFFTLAAYLSLCSLLLSVPLTLTASVLLIFFIVSNFIICQVNSINLLENETVLSPIAKEMLSLIKESLQNKALKLEQSISLLEGKLNYHKSKDSDFFNLYEKPVCLISSFKPPIKIRSNAPEKSNSNITTLSQSPRPS